MGKTGRFCVDCGSKLVYYPNLSNPKAPNEFRVLVYACPDCTKDFDKPKLISIKRNESEDPIETVRIDIVELKEKYEQKTKKSSIQNSNSLVNQQPLE